MKTNLFSKKEDRSYKTIPGSDDHTSDKKDAPACSGCECGPDGSGSISVGDGSAASTSYTGTSANSGSEKGPKGAKSVPVGDGSAAATSYNSNKNQSGPVNPAE